MDLSDVRRVARRFAPGPWTSRVLTVLGAVLVLAGLGGYLVRFHAFGSAMTLGVAAATPYVETAALLGTLLMAVGRQWIGLAAGLVVVALCLSSQLWLFTSDDAPADAVHLSVMTSNLRLGEADATAVVDAVRHNQVDVLMLEELTPDEQQHLVDQGLDDLLPYHRSEPRESAGGTGLWSRYPLTEVAFPGGFTFALITARVDVPGVAAPVTAIALHMAGPVPDPHDWTADIRRLPAALRTLPPGAPVIVGGDFNATPDTVQFRRLLRDGYRDAADQAGAGITATYPADRWYPPLLAIDHVLTRGGAVATGVKTITVRGSDHRALLVRVAVPRL
jgi:endonuclease/exonuclease/phosphatase (EEP) superfamily protein YafD